jgi:Protein ChrB, N-terminal
MQRDQWVLLAYRLPREPSTPRIAVWRRLRRLGALQLVDALVALPLDPSTREALEWVAEEVEQAGGEATVWLAEPAASTDERALARRMTEAAAVGYREVIHAADSAADGSETERRRTAARLRRELQRVRARDFFPPPERRQAERAVERLAA